MRSDTVTRPTQKMFDAMSSYPLGDDGRMDCPTTMRLERKIADIFGKEAAILTPSGIMANNLSMMLMASMKG